MKRFKKLVPQPDISPAGDVYAITALTLSEHSAMTMQCHLDIAYGPLDDNKLDIYVAETKLKNAPVYINIHGGGWTHGYKEWMGLNAPAVVSFGAVYVAIEYRLAGVAKFPAPLEDVLMAVAWVEKNIATYGGDPNRIFIGGHSAGAHLAALAVLRRDLHQHFGISADLFKGCFPYSGLYDLRSLTVYGGDGKSPGQRLLSDQKDEDAASPILWTKGNKVPFFVSWGGAEKGIIPAEGPAFSLALMKEKSLVETRMIPGLDHFSMHIDQIRPNNYLNRVLAAWMTGN